MTESAFWVGEDGAWRCYRCPTSGWADNPDDGFADAVSHYTSRHEATPITEEN